MLGGLTPARPPFPAMHAEPRHPGSLAFFFHGSPAAALAAAESRLVNAAALDWPHDAGLFNAHAAALGNDRPETLAALLAAL